MIRILHVVTTMDYGGVETLLMNLYRTIDRSQIQFDFLCMNTCDNLFSKEIEDLGGRMFSVPFISKVGYSGYKKQLRAFFDEHQEYKIVHSHVNSYNGFVLEAAKKSGIPNRISHMHVAHPVQPNVIKRIIQNLGAKKIPVYATDYFACSKEARDCFYKNINCECILFNNGIKTDRFKYDESNRTELRMKYNLSEEFIVGHVGRFDNVKNQIMAVKVFEKYLIINKNAVLWLIGEGERRKQVEEYVAEKNISHKVFFLGLQAEVEKYMSAMDVFLFPSYYEGLGIVAIEAQASGLPVIASTGVPKETRVTELIQYISLEKSEEWVNVLSKIEINNNRKMYADQVKESGYDIERLSRWLQDFYERRWKE